MARPLRIDVGGGRHHVTARGIERRSVFTDRRDHEHFLELLEESVERFRVVIHAHVEMANHTLCGVPHNTCVRIKANA